MSSTPIDTNVILRYLVEHPNRIAPAFRGVYPFFEKLEQGQTEVQLSELVLFQVFFVLTSHYEIPPSEAAEKLERLLSFRGIKMDNKHVAALCLARLQRENIDIVDAWLLAWCETHRCNAIYSFDKDFSKRGIALLPIQ